jgi:superfamily II DNA or RNA helicase
MDATPQRLTEFLATYAPALTSQIVSQFAPLHTPTTVSRETLIIPGLKRPLFTAQQDTVAALVAAFRHHRALGLAGEPGFGKTFTTLALARALGCRRVLILCPPHLVEEWREEADRSLAHCPSYIMEHVAEVEAAIAASRRTTAPLQLFILSHSRAKLRYGWEPAVMQRPWRVDGQRVVQLRCPSCGQELLDDQGAALAFVDLEKAQHQCSHCHSALWQPIATSRRLFPLAVYIRRKCPGVFDLLVADEAHELKAQSSAQALAFHKLMRACPRTLALTGTLSSGKASDFFPLLYRLAPEIRAQYQHDDTLAFVRDYGILEQVTYHDDTTIPHADRDEDGSGSIRKGERGKVYERPGLSPAIVPVLLNRFVFLRLSDIAQALPPYEEFVHPLALPAPVARAYASLEAQILSWTRKHRGTTLAQFLQVLLAYPDQPWVDEAIMATIHDQAGSRQRAVVTRTIPQDPAVRYPKEAALLELLRRERARGRKVLVFAIHTDQRDILPRLMAQAAQDEIRLAALRASGEARTRKQQLQRLLAQGADGIICHPRLVQTGLNLTMFPTIAFVQFDYSTFTLRQASRRSYRPSQTQPVEVHFFCYSETVQEKGLALMARKLRSALMAEGEFVEDGLSAFDDDGDITRELTRSLLYGHAIPGLEETFAALRALRSTTEAAVPAASPPSTADMPLHASPIMPERAAGLARPVLAQNAEDHARAVQQLEALRVQKQAILAQRKRVTVARTLAGNPGQLSLFGQE